MILVKKEFALDNLGKLGVEIPFMIDTNNALIWLRILNYYNGIVSNYSLKYNTSDYTLSILNEDNDYDIIQENLRIVMHYKSWNFLKLIVDLENNKYRYYNLNRFTSDITKCSVYRYGTASYNRLIVEFYIKTLNNATKTFYTDGMRITINEN